MPSHHRPRPAVGPASPADLAYVVHLQRRHHEALGFIPRQALAEKIEQGRVWLASENGEPAGFLHHGTLARPEVRIFQAAVQYDVRRRHLGLALVADLVRRAQAAGARAVSLRCLSFLEANDFWSAAGFELVTAEPGAKGTLNVWGLQLPSAQPGRLTTGTGNALANDRASSTPVVHDPAAFAFHSRLHPCPGCRCPTMGTWTRGAVRHAACPRCVVGVRTAAPR